MIVGQMIRGIDHTDENITQPFVEDNCERQNIWANRPLGAVYNEDCLITMENRQGNSIDLSVTSPPYDDMRAYSGNDFRQFEEIAHALFRVTKPGGVLVWINW